MDYFILTSKRFIKEWNPAFHFFFVDDNAVNSCSEISSFSVSIVKSYFQYLLLRLKIALNMFDELPAFERRISVINKIYKHVLVIEWGFYDNKAIASNFDLLLSGGLDSNARPDNVIDYKISHNDLSKPIFKISPHRYTSHEVFDPAPPVIPKTFFFNFYLFMPASSFCLANPNIKMSDLNVYNLKSPFEIDFPILFEFFLLKFTFFSMLFSFSNITIYEFYSLGFVESVFIRLRSILDKIVIFLFKSFWITNTFDDFNSLIIKRSLNFIGTSLFYSKSVFKHYNIFFFYLKTYSNFKFESLKFLNLPINFWFSLILTFEFALIFVFIAATGYDQITVLFFLNLRTSLRFLVIKFFFYVFLFILILYLCLYLVVIFYYFLSEHSIFYILHVFKFRFEAYINVILLNAFERLFQNFFIIVILVLLFDYFAKSDSRPLLDFFVCTLAAYYFIRFVNSLIVFVLRLHGHFFYPNKKRDNLTFYLDKKDFNACLLILLPFSLIVYSFLSFICLSILTFCYFLRVFYPPVLKKKIDKFIVFDKLTYTASSFKLPFTEYSMSGFSTPVTFLDFANPVSIQFALSKGFSMKTLMDIQDIIKPSELREVFPAYKESPDYSLGLLRKFLIDRNKRLFEIEYLGFDFFNNKYLSRKITYFPNKLLYCFIILTTFIWWFFLNLLLISSITYFKLYYFFNYLVFGTILIKNKSLEKFLFKNFSNDLFLIKEILVEYSYSVIWLNSNTFFSYNANSYNKKLYKNLFTFSSF